MVHATESSKRGGQTLSLSFLTGMNGPYLQVLFEKYLQDPKSIDPSLKEYFQGLEETTLSYPRGAQPRNASIYEKRQSCSYADTADALAIAYDSMRAFMLIRAHEEQGHFLANLDPLGLEKRVRPAALDPATYGFEACDYKRPFYLHKLWRGLAWTTLEEIVQHLKAVYGGTVGIEFTHLQDARAKAWIQQQIEGRDQFVFSAQEKKELLHSLARAELFEKFLAVKFPGAKRFGLEGGESFVALLERVLLLSASFGLKETIIGMAHRGRLNVLANVVGKPLRAIFAEFQGKFSALEDMRGSGDVKYHLGASVDRMIHGDKIHLSLAANPSHLEAVNPVVLGKVRAKQNLRKDENRDQVMGILVHGDAAFAGQGIVAETLLLSNLEGYGTGGTIHVIINNQVGFTTSPKFSRSSTYCSDGAKAIQAPVVHVNGDDPEAVLWASQFASTYRSIFKKDVVIDLVCYRRHGHNEMDEPSFTQPVMYKRIKTHPTTHELYASQLCTQEVLSVKEVESILHKIQENLQDEFAAVSEENVKKPDCLVGLWSNKTWDVQQWEGDTGVDLSLLKEIGSCLVKVPSQFVLNPKIERLFGQKQEMFEKGEGVDWATAEACAFGSLLRQGYDVRLSGQDSGRGTFSHRHAVLVDQEQGTKYIPLNHLSSSQGRFEVIDSPLAEASVLGFELGYSLAHPDTLVLWEAQFGDFANGAQVIIDQFISSQEVKWLRLSGLVMLLPHGYEGQGPEHSSARLERYLQLCAEDNMVVANCTTPANYFHILRRQLVKPVRKPLILMTPKSLLRDKAAVSNLEDMAPQTAFQKILGQATMETVPQEAVKRVILCAGKIAYELEERKRAQQRFDVIIVRVEQLYPFPHHELVRYLKPYAHATFVWCQEEPQNMGAWTFVDRRLEKVLHSIGATCSRPLYAGRTEAAATATGFHKEHEMEQAQLVKDALG